MTARRAPSLLRREVLAPALVLFTILIAHALLETARDALFLAELGPHLLAAAYVVMAMFAVGAIFIVRRSSRLRHPRRVLIAFLAVAVAGTAVLAMTVSIAPSLVFVLYVWTGLTATLVVPSFWAAIDRSLRVTEAKRSFGAIGAGGVFGAMVGSALAGLIGRAMDATFIVTAGAIAFAIALVVAIVLVPRAKTSEIPAKKARVAQLSKKSRGYLRLLLVFGVVSTVVLTLGDLTFKRVMSERVAADELASAFGAIYTVLNTIALAIQLIVTPRLLARWGVGGALMVLPLIIVSSAFGFALTGATVAVICLKLGDGGLRHSVHRVGSEILYLPVPAKVRDGGKLVADALGQRGGQALAAVLVFASAWLGATSHQIAAVTVLAGVGWLIVLAVVRRAYVEQFRDTLMAGEIQRDVAIPPLDADSIELLTESLSSPDEIEALAALDLLARRAGVPTLVFYHPRASVVRHALSLLAGDLRPEVARVLRHLLTHSDPKIRAAAYAASVRTGGGRDQLVAALDDPEPEVRAAALVGLVGTGNDRDLDVGIAALVDGTADDRLALADAIGFAPHERFRGVLYELLAYGEPAVVRRVLQIIARAPSLADLDRLLPLLADAGIRADTRRVFLATGAHGLEVLVGALDDPSTTKNIRRHLPRTISRFRSSIAANALVTRLPHEGDGRTEFKILRALGRMRTDDPRLAIDGGPLREYIRRAVRDAARYAVFMDELVGERARWSASAELIHEILVEKRWTAVEHVFRALGILYPSAGLRSAFDAFANGDELKRSAAREIVEAMALSDVRPPLLAILEDIPADQRRARLGELAPGPYPSYEAFLAGLLHDPSESLRCVVAYHIAERQLVGLRDELARLIPDGSQFVTHAYDQAIARLHG
jgi:AAA family ATP:ADP antiporter